MSEILFLAHRLPYPPDKGDKIRSWHFLRHLAASHRVHLGCLLDDPADHAHLPLLRKLCASVHAVPIRPEVRRLASLRGLLTGEPLTFPYCADRRLRAWIRELAGMVRLDLAFAYSSGMAPLIAPAALDVPRRVVDLVDLDSEKWRLYGAETAGPTGWIWRREAGRLAAAEVAITGWADATLLVSDAEAADLRRRPGVPTARVACVGNGVDLAAFDPNRSWPRPDSLPPAGAPVLVFTGAMDYRPNIDAALWFADETLPRLLAHRPDLRFAVVGARPSPAVRRLATRPGILVTGRVPDIRPWLAHATLVVAPLRIARGVQNKVLEAMAMARPVLCTPAAATGLELATGQELAVADGADAFAAGALALLVDSARRRALAAAACRRVAADYDWRLRLVDLDRIVG
ncbi:MAG: TIGR03087 family PEP-CTERM/XrtA system glycosyltransferase [Geminicoccaceae bacterium]